MARAKKTIAEFKAEHTNATVISEKTALMLKADDDFEFNPLTVMGMMPVAMSVHGISCIFPSALHAFFAHRISAKCPNKGKYLNQLQRSVSGFQGLFLGSSLAFIEPKGKKLADMPYFRDPASLKDPKKTPAREFMQDPKWGDIKWFEDVMKNVLLARVVTNPIFLPMLLETGDQQLISLVYGDDILHSGKNTSEGEKFAFTGLNIYGRMLEEVRNSVRTLIVKSGVTVSVPIANSDQYMNWTVEEKNGVEIDLNEDEDEEDEQPVVKTAAPKPASVAAPKPRTALVAPKARTGTAVAIRPKKV